MDQFKKRVNNVFKPIVRHLKHLSVFYSHVTGRYPLLLCSFEVFHLENYERFKTSIFFRYQSARPGQIDKFAAKQVYESKSLCICACGKNPPINDDAISTSLRAGASDFIALEHQEEDAGS